MRHHLPALGLLAASGLFAQDPQPDALPEVEVRATRLAGADQPFSLHGVDRRDMEERGGRALVDAADRMPGVVVQRTAPNQASPYIRGLTGQQTLILFDGVRLNHALFRSGPNQYAALIPEEAVDRVDAVLGAGSTALGSDGLSGALDFRLAPAGRGTARAADPFVQGRWGSADGGRAALGVDGRAGRWAWSVDGSLADLDGVRGGKDSGRRLYGPAAGKDEIPDTGYRQTSLGARLGWQGGGGLTADLALGRVTQQDAPRADGYYENSDVKSRVARFYDPQVFEYLHLRAGGLGLGRIGGLAPTLWYHRHEEEMTQEDVQASSGRNRFRRRVYDDGVSTLGLDLQVKSGVAAHDLTWGLTAYEDRLDSRLDTSATAWNTRSVDWNRLQGASAAPVAGGPGSSTVPDGSTYAGRGAYVQDSWRLGGRWSLLPGLRLDRAEWKMPVTADRAGFASAGNTTLRGDDEALCASLRLSFKPEADWTTFAGVSQGFRAPTVNDLAGSTSRASGAVAVVANPALAAERSTTCELGIRWERARERASFSVYRTSLRDLMQSRYADGDGDGRVDGAADSAQSVNASRGWVQGVELAGEHVLAAYAGGGRLSAFHATSLVQGRVEMPQPAGGSAWENLSRANQAFGRLGLRLEIGRAWWGLAQARWSDAYTDTAPTDKDDTRMSTVHGDGSMPGWGVLDLRVGWTWAGGRRNLSVGLDNVLDATYRQVGSGADGAGRNLMVGGGVRI